MTGMTPLNVHLESNLALLQRIDEDLAGHVTFDGGDPNVVGSGQEIIEQLKTAVAALKQEIDAILVNAKWSDEHKLELVTEAVRGFYKKQRETIAKAEATKRAAANQARQSLTAVPEAKTNETTDFMISKEIRERLRAMPQSERMTCFAHAVATKNGAVQRAIAHDPLHEELLPRDYVDRVVQEHAEATNGPAWQRMESLELLADRLHTIVTALDLSFQNFNTTPVFQTPPIGHADLKTKDTSAPPKKGPADKAPAQQPQFQ